MNNRGKPTKGAMQAAVKLVSVYGDGCVTKNANDPDVIRAAQIIDEETGVAELIDALKTFNAFYDDLSKSNPGFIEIRILSAP